LRGTWMRIGATRWAWLALGAVGFFTVPLVFPAAGVPAAVPLTAAAPTAWSTPAAFDFGNHTYLRSLDNVSCASTALCVGVDLAGNVVISTDPADPSPTWTVTNVDGTNSGNNALEGVSCPTSTFCAVVDYDGGNVITSTDPSDGASATWTVTNVVPSSVG